MKHLFSLLTVLLLPLLVSAQEGLVAVLYHGDDFKTYYSSEAFKNAMVDAENGDIITLSPGTFTAATLNKAVTIRGAGIGSVDPMNNETTPQTIINGSPIYANVNPESSSGHTLNIEGIVFNGSFSIYHLSDAIISKTRFNSYVADYNNDAVIDNITFIQCIFDESIGLKSNHSCSVYNSVLKGFHSDYPKANIINSVVLIPNSYCFFDNNNLTYRNCIFVSDHDTAYMSSSIVNNCVWTGKHSENDPFLNANGNPDRNNKVIPEDEEIFIEGSFYMLNENGKGYLGSDGTEVGIYGSGLPFSTVTSYPQIKKFNISPESTTDGKLKIEFEIQ